MGLTWSKIDDVARGINKRRMKRKCTMGLARRRRGARSCREESYEIIRVNYEKDERNWAERLGGSVENTGRRRQNRAGSCWKRIELEGRSHWGRGARNTQQLLFLFFGSFEFHNTAAAWTKLKLLRTMRCLLIDRPNVYIMERFETRTRKFWKLRKKRIGASSKLLMTKKLPNVAVRW